MFLLECGERIREKANLRLRNEVENYGNDIDDEKEIKILSTRKYLISERKKSTNFTRHQLTTTKTTHPLVNVVTFRGLFVDLI